MVSTVGAVRGSMSASTLLRDASFQAPHFISGRLPVRKHRGQCWQRMTDSPRPRTQAVCAILHRQAVASLLPSKAQGDAALGSEDGPSEDDVHAAVEKVGDAEGMEQETAGARHRRLFRSLGGLVGGKAKLPNIKQLGLYAVLSYGFVSNASYAICVALAWFAASKKSGLSPLAPDQWQVFVVTYAAFFAINNVLRVPRFALSVSLAPAFDRLIAVLMRRTGRGKTFATVLCVVVVNIFGTIALLATGVALASLLSGVPIWPASSP